MFFVTVFLLLAVVAIIYLFLTSNFCYWKKLGVNGPKPQLLVGNFPNLFTQKRCMAYDVDDHYRKYKKTEDFVGIYSARSPQLLITSPALAHRVYVTDFKHFHDNEISTMVNESSDFIFANNPFTLTGEAWKERRAEVTPGITSSRIKTVYPVTNKVCKKLTDYIRKQTRMAPKDGIDGKDTCLRFTSEVVTDCVLGLNADSFAEKPTPILGQIQNLFESTISVLFYFVAVALFPMLKHFYKIRFIPKTTEKFFVDLMQSAIDMRKSQIQQKQSLDRVDFLNYMLQLQEKKNLSTKQLMSHTMTFLLDGFETTASVTAHCLLLLGRHPTIQEKVRSEFQRHVDENGVVDFDVLNELPYLDACIHESIRVFPPGFFSNKLCTEPIELINKNGRSLTVKKGDVITVPIYSLMMDEDYYINPQEFQPERFLEENGGVKKYRDSGVFFGFGDGPRVCLGMRFALTQTKAAIVEVLTNFTVRVNPKTRKDNLLDPKYFLSRLDGGIWLDFEERNLLLYLFLIWNFSYWKKLGVNGPKPQIFVGNYPNIFSKKRHLVYDLDDIYRKYKQDEHFVGIYSARIPQLLITSPALARQVYVTDFKHFHDNEASQFVDKKSDYMFANNPFMLTGEEWKEKRAELLPGLTKGRVKNVYPVTNKICKKMTDYIREQTLKPPKDGLDGKNICLRFTSEVVTECVLGLNADSFGNRPTPILSMISTIFDLSFVMAISWNLFGFFPILKRFHKIRFIPKQTEEFFEYLMQNGIDFCKSQRKQNAHHCRIDFLNYMLQLQEKKNLSNSQLTAHTMTFLLEGFETTASVIAHCLLMLARYPTIQKKVCDEFKEHVDKNGVVDFDALMELPYLDACIHESIRFFPPGFYANKICTEPIELTNKNGHTLHVQKGDVIVLPIYSLMMDEEYYSNPYEFQPERFLEENGGLNKYRKLGVYYGFGEGPRICLGIRFALAQTKAAIVEILRNFIVRVNPKTSDTNTLDPQKFVALLDGGIWLDFEAKI